MQPAACVVVAGNGIGTARLLLASGLDSPALGRNLMFHPAAYLRGMFARSWTGRSGRSAAPSIPTNSTRPMPRRGFKRGVHLQVTRENRAADPGHAPAAGLGREAHRKLREEFRHSIVVLVHGRGPAGGP